MPHNHNLAPIQNGVTYPLDEFQRRSGLGRHSLRQARRHGLIVRRLGGRAFVCGSDFNEFLTSQPLSSTQLQGGGAE